MLGPAQDLLHGLPAEVPVTDHRDMILVPGFIDTHVHSAQLDIIAAPGAKLLDWLQRHAYPEEARFADPEHAMLAAGTFVDELLRNGTTTALVFATVHPGSVDALFEAALERSVDSGGPAVIHLDVDRAEHMWAPGVEVFKAMHLEPGE